MLESAAGCCAGAVPGPATAVPEPIVAIAEPVAEVPESGVAVPEPVAEVPEPAAEVPEPAAEVPEPAAEVPELAAEVAGPATGVLGSPSWFFEPDPAASGSGGTKMESNSGDGLMDDFRRRCRAMPVGIACRVEPIRARASAGSLSAHGTWRNSHPSKYPLSCWTRKW